MSYEDKRFKIGITFSGKYREKYIEPICKALLNIGYKKDEIFYDSWHEVLLNGPHGDSKLQKIYNERCDCVVVLLSPDYNEKNWTKNIEWSAVREMINTGRGEKICLLGIDDIDIGKIDGLYMNQAIAKFIDNMDSKEVADFIHEKYRQIIGQETTENPCQYTLSTLGETRVFIKELSSLKVVIAPKYQVSIISQLKKTLREGKRVRLKDWKNPKIKARSIYDHMISLAYLADVIGHIGKYEQESRKTSEIARLIAYHEIPEALIGDIASYTNKEPLIKGPERFEASVREPIVNNFIKLYADVRQQESIEFLNSRINPAGKQKKYQSEQMEYFKALDHLDCLVAIWRYLFYYRDTCTKKELLDFVENMSDFFNNKRLREEKLFIIEPAFKQIISFLSKKDNAKKYVTGDSIEQQFNGKNREISDAIEFLIEKVPLFCGD